MEAITIKIKNILLLLITLISKSRNFIIRFSSPIIARTEAKESNNMLKFIAKDGKSGRIFGSLKYRIVESKMILLIAALNPLMIKKIITDKGRAIKYPKYLCLIFWEERRYFLVYLNICTDANTTKRIVVKNSIGDFTIPHPNADEKYDGSDNEPFIKLDGNPTTKIIALRMDK